MTNLNQPSMEAAIHLLSQLSAGELGLAISRLQDKQREIAASWPRVVVPSWTYRVANGMEWERRKIPEIKMVRYLTGMGLKGAKDLVEIGVDTNHLTGMILPTEKSFYSVPYLPRVRYETGDYSGPETNKTIVGSVTDFYACMRVPFTLFKLKGAAR